MIASRYNYIEADLCVEGPFDRPIAEKTLLVYETK
jgi:hypothetical protein